jgi:hypothetical protein
MGLLSASAYAECPLDGYSDSSKVTVNGKPLVCQGIQRTYQGAGAMKYFRTAVCSTEKTAGPALKTAVWIANSIEEIQLTGNSYTDAFGKDCTFTEVGPEVNGWKCQKWEKDPTVRIEMDTCHNFNEAFEYSVTEQQLSDKN